MTSTLSIARIQDPPPAVGDGDHSNDATASGSGSRADTSHRSHAVIPTPIKPPKGRVSIVKPTAATTPPTTPLTPDAVAADGRTSAIEKRKKKKNPVKSNNKTKKPSGSNEERERRHAAERRLSFLKHVKAQQRQPTSGGGAEAGQDSAGVDDSSPPPSTTTTTASGSNSRIVTLVYSSRLETAPDGIHYLECVAERGLVDTHVLPTDHQQPLCVVLVQRVRNTSNTGSGDSLSAGERVVVRHLPMAHLLSTMRASNTGSSSGGGGADKKKRSRNAEHNGGDSSSGRKRVHAAHGGKEGLSSMHLEVDGDFSFMPWRLQADSRRALPVSKHPTAAAANSSSNNDINGGSFHPPAAPPPEPAVYDLFVPGPMRGVELLHEKHRGGVHYLKHKLKYTKAELEALVKEDHRRFLACERREVFLRLLQRDLQGRLASEQVRERRLAHQRRMGGRINLDRGGVEVGDDGGGQAINNSGINGSSLDDVLRGRATTTTGPATVTTTINGLSYVQDGATAGGLYTVGREIPTELVQSFFTLNDEYDILQRCLARQRSRSNSNGYSPAARSNSRLVKHSSSSSSGDGGGGGGGRTTGGQRIISSSSSGSSNRASEWAGGGGKEGPDRSASMMRWGDALIFPGQRPADGYVVVTAGPRGMRGWRAVLAGREADRESRGAVAFRRRNSPGNGNGNGNGRSRAAVTAPRHIDLYAMAHRNTTPPPQHIAVHGNGNNRNSNNFITGGGSEGDDDEDDGPAYMRHFRYRLFYANDSDCESDDDMLCSEEDDDGNHGDGADEVVDGSGGEQWDAPTAYMRRPSCVLSRRGGGPVVYGTGHYLPNLSTKTSHPT